MAAQTDLSSLLEMGFAKERAEIALKNSGGIQGALEWLERTQDQSLEEILKSEPKSDVGSSTGTNGNDGGDEGLVVRSFVCNDCGKKLRTERERNFHAEKSGHDDFAQSAEELPPLTAEEKKAAVEQLKAKAAAKKAELSEQDKIDKKRNEEIRRKSTKQTQDIKEDLKKKQHLKEAEAKRKEKKDEELARKKIKEKIEADKEARRQRAAEEKAEREGRAPTVQEQAPASTTSGPVASKPASAYTETRLRLQTPSGNVLKTLPVETTLFEVASALSSEDGIQAQSFVQNFPKKTFDQVDFGATLKELGLVPSASLIVK